MATATSPTGDVATPMTEIVTHFRGVPVNVTSWSKHHPGGSKLLKLFNDKDCTDVFMAMHTEEAQARLMTLIDVQNKDKGGKEAVLKPLTKEQQKYADLQRTAHAKGLYKPVWWDELFKAAYSFGSSFLGLYLMLATADSQWLGAAFLAFGWFQLGWLGHDWSHHTALGASTTRWAQINNNLGYASALIRGTMLTWWKLRHNTHHALTNQLGHDPDIRTAPLFRFVEDHNPNCLTRWQAAYYVPTLCLLHIYWFYESWEVAVRQSGSSNRYVRKEARKDVVGMILHTAGAAYVIYQGCGLPLLAAYAMSGFATAVVVFASHYAEERLPATTKYGLIRQTVASTRNIRGFLPYDLDGAFWFHLTGGLSHQIEHHLFPMMPRHNLRLMTPYVKEAAQQLGLPYNSDHLGTCTLMAVRNLAQNTARNLFKVVKKGVEEVCEAKAQPSSSARQLRSIGGASRVLSKIISLAVLGGTLVFGCCFPGYMRAIGVVVNSVAFTGLDMVRDECRSRQFFPSDVLNSIGSRLFKWEVMLASLAVFYLTAQTLESETLFSFCKYWALPVMLMRMNMASMRLNAKSDKPARVNSSQLLLPELREAAEAVQRLLDSQHDFAKKKAQQKRSKKESGSDSESPRGLVQRRAPNEPAMCLQELPMYAISQFSSQLTDTYKQAVTKRTGEQAGHEKQSPPATGVLGSILWVLMSPLRLLVRLVFAWESRDWVLHVVIASFLLLVLFSWSFWAYTPLCILFPLFAPRSRAALALNELQTLATDTAIKEGRFKAEKVELWRRINWPMCAYMLISHGIAAYAVVIMAFNSGVELTTGTQVQPLTIVFAIFCWFASTFGVTVGAHRYWSHGSFKATTLMRVLMLIGSSLANQGTVYHWVRDHRTFHARVKRACEETTKMKKTNGKPEHDDGHCSECSTSSTKSEGLAEACESLSSSRLSWAVKKSAGLKSIGRREVDMSDLDKDWLVQFQRSVDPYWNLIWCFACPAFTALLWGDSLANGFLVAGCLRYVLTLHLTTFINSVRYGHNTAYNSCLRAADSPFVSLITLGEGWHNWHHSFPSDHQASELACWQQFNLTALVIKLAALLRLASALKSSSTKWEARQRFWQRQLDIKATDKSTTDKPTLLAMDLTGLPMCKARRVNLVDCAAPPAVKAVKEAVESDVETLEVPSAAPVPVALRLACPDDDDVSVDNWHARGAPSVAEVVGAIPASCKERCFWRSSMFVARDAALAVVITLATLSVQSYIVSLQLPAVVHSASMMALAVVYAVVQGTVWTGLWVIGHECGHGAYAQSAAASNAVGFVLHSALLVPYFSWQFSHAKHHKYTNHLVMGESHVPATVKTVPGLFRKIHKTLGEDAFAFFTAFVHLVYGWPLYLIRNDSGGRVNWKGERLNRGGEVSHFTTMSQLFPPRWHMRVLWSSMGCFAVIAGLVLAAMKTSTAAVFFWYVGPYLVTNAWLVLLTWLQHTDKEVPQYGTESHSWLRGALGTIDRPYPDFIDELHHHIGTTHVLHHLDHHIPHYNAPEATFHLKHCLGEYYRYDPRTVPSALWAIAKDCVAVAGVTSVQRWLNMEESTAVYKQQKDSQSEESGKETKGSVADTKGGAGKTGKDKGKEGKEDMGKSSNDKDGSATTVMTGSDKQCSQPTAPMEMSIRGRIVDVSTFIKRHPGGSIIKFQIGTDATEAYEAFHIRSKKAEKILGSLPSRAGSLEVSAVKHVKGAAKVSATNKDGMFVGDSALVADFVKLRTELKNEGWFDPSIPVVVLRAAELVVMHVVGAVMLSATAGSLSNPFTWLALFILGLAQGRCGWYMHEGGHYSLTGNIKIDRALQIASYGLGTGMSAAYWRNQHNKHHAAPQKLQHDVDLDTLPFVAFSAKIASHPFVKKNKMVQMWLKFQHYLFCPVVTLMVALFWTFYLHPRHALRTKQHAELATFAVRFAALAAYMQSLQVPFFQGLVLYLSYMAVAGGYIFVNFAVSHTHLPVVDKEEHADWVQYASAHTMNASNCIGVNWWMAYLNFQIEHHLFPSMPQYRFPKISHRVRALFESHGYEYRCEGYFKALQVTFSNLAEVAKHAH